MAKPASITRFGKEIALQLCYQTGLHQTLARLVGGLGTIFCMHRVVPDKSEVLARQLTVTPAFLDQVIRRFKSRGARFVRMDEVFDILVDDRVPEGRFVALTFDDGYRDNVTHALPILREHDVPATIYVPSGAPERSLGAWWLRLERAILAEDEITLEVPGLEPRISTETLPEKIAAYWTLTKYIHRNLNVNPSIAAQLLPLNKLSDEALNAEYFLGWDELRQVAVDPLIAIGAHSVSHAELSTIGEIEALKEMTEGRDRLVSELDCPVEHFAYPYGAVDGRGPGLAEKAGFKTAVTLQGGNVFPEHRRRLMCLPRPGLGGTRERMQDAELDFSGARAALSLRRSGNTGYL